MTERHRHGYDVGAGRFNPMLDQLEAAGNLRVWTDVVAGKQRKYYRATAARRRCPGRGQVEAWELVSEVLARQGRPRRPSHRTGARADCEARILSEAMPET